MTRANGPLVDGDQLVAGTVGAFPPPPTTGVATRLGDLAGTFDGVDNTTDGAYLVSDFGGEVYEVQTDGTYELVADYAQLGLTSTADSGYHPATKTLMISDLPGNKVFWSTLP